MPLGYTLAKSQAGFIQLRQRNIFYATIHRWLAQSQLEQVDGDCDLRPLWFSAADVSNGGGGLSRVRTLLCDRCDPGIDRSREGKGLFDKQHQSRKLAQR